MIASRSSLVVLVSSVAACFGQPEAPLAADAAGPPREVVRETRSLAAGQLVEGILTGGTADLAILRFEAPAMELDWNIHGHPTGMSTVTVHEQLNQALVDFAFTPSAQGDWYLLLRNSGPASMDVVVEIGLYGDMTWAWQ